MVLPVTMKMNGMKPNLSFAFTLVCWSKRVLDPNKCSNLQYKTSYPTIEISCMNIKTPFDALNLRSDSFVKFKLTDKI